MKVILAVIITLPALIPVIVTDVPDDVTVAKEVLLEVHATDRIAFSDVTERLSVLPSYNLSVVLFMVEIYVYVITTYGLRSVMAVSEEQGTFL